MPYLTVTRRRPSTFEVDIEGRKLVVEERVAGTAHGAGPTALELMVASFASAVASRADAYLAELSCQTAGLRVVCHYRLSATDAQRVSSIDLTLSVPEALSDQKRAGLVNAVGECTAGGWLRGSPDVAVMLVGVPAHDFSAR